MYTPNRSKPERSESFSQNANLPRVHSFQIADLEEVPHGIQRQSKNLKDYKFPTHRLRTRLEDPNKFPLVIVACGSFSPITYLHLRMFEMALDAIREQTRFEVIGGFYSPVSDNYRKQGLAPSSHRKNIQEPHWCWTISTKKLTLKEEVSSKLVSQMKKSELKLCY
ncbi:unnamed protein product [[Candida] boidinii]|uniref:Unnamed protein product n=1 Tax=Candida boidinii TaxID=5477 RepID=A0A9W6T8S6_CANBO|nr:unnamed protein product [[Candida] boidinii]